MEKAAMFIVVIPFLVWVVTWLLELLDPDREPRTCKCGRRFILPGGDRVDGNGMYHDWNRCQPERERL